LDHSTPATVRPRFDSTWRARELDVDSLDSKTIGNSQKLHKYKSRSNSQSGSLSEDSDTATTPLPPSPPKSLKKHRKRSHSRSRERSRGRSKMTLNELEPEPASSTPTPMPMATPNTVQSLQKTILSEIQEKKALSENIIVLRQLVNDNDSAQQMARTAEIITSRALKQLSNTLKFLQVSAKSRRRTEYLSYTFRNWSNSTNRNIKTRRTLQTALNHLNLTCKGFPLPKSKNARLKMSAAFNLWNLRSCLISDRQHQAVQKARTLAGMNIDTINDSCVCDLELGVQLEKQEERAESDITSIGSHSELPTLPKAHPPHLCFSPRVLFMHWKRHLANIKLSVTTIRTLTTRLERKTLRKYLYKLLSIISSLKSESFVARIRTDSQLTLHRSEDMMGQFETTTTNLQTTQCINSIAARIISTALIFTVRCVLKQTFRSWRGVKISRRQKQKEVASRIWHFAFLREVRMSKSAAFGKLKGATVININRAISTFLSRTKVSERTSGNGYNHPHPLLR